ncbi:MAG: hypothetical protein EOO31_08295 [Comamonadaceae bacterium]|nr:MAG: hypothetical protein EOO31_08295 [Comamonadaceae bacterium]
MKYLVLLAVLVVAYAVWRSQRQGAVQDAKTKPRTPLVQNMVACAHCGIHLPAADAVLHQGHHYCSPAHRQLGPA